MCVGGEGYLKLQPSAPAFKEHMYICSIDVHLASCRALSESSHGMKWSDCGNERIQGRTLEEPANEVGCSLSFSSIIRTMKLIFILFSREILKSGISLNLNALALHFRGLELNYPESLALRQRFSLHLVLFYFLGSTSSS